MATNTNTELTLANSFIQSKFTLEAMEVKLLYAIAYKLQNGDRGLNTVDLLKAPDDNSIYYTANEMANFLGIKKNAYHHFYRICKSLIGKNVSIKNLNDPKGFEILSFLIKANYSDGILELVPNPYMKQFYMNLTKNYTRLELIQVLRMKSTYAIRIYSFIKMKAQQKRNAYLFELAEFKELLGLENRYARIQDLQKRVLDPAKEELNKIIPKLEFDYTLIKIGKSIKQIRLTFNRNALEYVSFQDELYFRAYEKYGKYCKDGQYCNPDESQECQYCRLKIKKRNE